MRFLLAAILLTAPGPLVAQSAEPPAIPLDSPEEIAADAARDLKDSRFYNRPGATRADYNTAWQECRLIARGSRTPGGQTVVVPYNPAVISPVAAGVGAGIGAVIAGAIAEGEARRANRRSCLMVRGWRAVEVADKAERARIVALSDPEREAFSERIVGAETLPEGFVVTAWRNDFAAPRLKRAEP